MIDTFVFVLGDMRLGGIEMFLLRRIRWMKKKGYRVIYLCTKKKPIIDDSFINDISAIEFYYVNFRNPLWLYTLKLNLPQESKVQVYTFNIIDFSFVEALRCKFRNSINTFYWIPNFEGLFIENHFGVFRPIIRKIIGRQYKLMEKNNNLFYVNPSHAETAMKNYDYVLVNNGLKFSKIQKETPPFNMNLSKERFKHENFNIIVITRFVFPHKGFILGLLDQFNGLISKYPYIRLTIIGYGKDENVFLDKLNKLPSDTIKAINYVGKVSYDTLGSYFKNASLNIGVASTISDGAITGLISLPARHYTYDCEGYGFLPESKNYRTSSLPGISMDFYIEKVLKFSQKEYIEYSRKSHETFYISQEELDKRVLEEFHNSNVLNKKTLSFSFFLFIFLYNLIKDMVKFTYAIFKMKN